MFTNKTVAYILAVLMHALLCMSLVVRAEETNPVVSKATVLALLPTGPDMLDEKICSDYQKLLNMGEAAIPHLGEIMTETSNSLTVLRVLGTFAQLKGNRSAALEPTKRMLNKFSDNSSDAASIRSWAAQVLGVIGGPSDAPVLYTLLDDPVDYVRVNSLRSLANIGTAETLTLLETMLSARGKDFVGKPRSDYFFQECGKAVESIKRRQAEAQKQLEPL